MNRTSDIIYFSLFRDDNPYSSVSYSLAIELARNNRVFYINHPYSYKDVLKGLKSGDAGLKKRLSTLLKGKMYVEEKQPNLIVIQPPVTLPINWMNPGNQYERMYEHNNRIVLRTIQQVIDTYAVKDFVYLNCFDPFFAGSIPSDMGARIRIYQCIDDISQDPYTNRHGLRLENEAVAAADLTIATSTQLKKLKKAYSENVETLFNAADFSNFTRTRNEEFPVPSELGEKKHKVIGFVGNLDGLRIDYPLIKAVAVRHSDKTILLVGPINSGEIAELGIDKLPNVVFTGSKHISELPSYLQHMDVVLIPFLVNTLTASIYPLKINEYLAAGKPVVSTSFSEDIRTFSDVIYLAAHQEDFLKLIDRAIAEDGPERQAAQLRVAESNTWTARVERLWELVEQYEPARQELSGANI